MKIQYVSDLHLEFEDNQEYFLENPIKPVGDILIIAGDLAYLEYYKTEKFIIDFLNYCSLNWSKTYIIPGNHEFYTLSKKKCPYTISNTPNEIAFRKNVIFKRNGTKTYDDIIFIFTEIWSEVNEYKYHNIQRYNKPYMNDYNYIKYDDKLDFSMNINRQLHYYNLNILEKTLAKIYANAKTRNKNIVIVSHHAPSDKCLENQTYIDPILNQNYATNLHKIIYGYNNIRYWIHGHIHSEAIPIKINNCEIIKNVCGYVHKNHPVLNKFKLDKIVEL